jgi:hypothetical protein
MTIEIRQLIIRASVQARPEADSRLAELAELAESSSSRASLPANDSRDASGSESGQHDALVAACVREVLRKLERARGR